MANKSFELVIKEAQVVARSFADHDPRPWPAEVKIADLLTHLGSLTERVLESEGYKKGGKNKERLARELATIFFILIDVSDYYKVDFSKTFRNLLEETRRQLKTP